MTIEQVIRVVFDDNAYTRNVAQAAQATGRFDASVNSVQRGLQSMSTSAIQAAQAQAATGSATTVFVSALDRGNASLRGADTQLRSLGQAGKLTARELQQVGFQLNDLFVQLASGGNPFVALIQQGSQLSGTFGGVGNAARALTSLITPMGVAIAAAAAATGVFAVAAAKTEQWQRAVADLQATLQGTGRGGQFSDSQLGAIIDQLARAPGVTRDAATKSVAELARVQSIGVDLFQGLARVAADYARITGTDVPTASKTLAQAFADPAQGAKQLESVLGTLSATTLLSAQRLADQGNAIGAQSVLFAGLEQAVRGAALNGLTPLQKATNDLGNAWDKTMGSFRESEGLKNANAGLSSLLTTVARAIEQLPELEQRARSTFKGTLFGLVVDKVLTPPQTGSVSASFDAPGAQAEVSSTDVRIKAALKLGEAYKTQASEITGLVAKQKTLREALALAGPGTEEAKALQDRIAGVGDRISSLRKRGGSDIDRETKRIAGAAIEEARRSAQAQTSVIERQNEDLRGQYEAGLLSLADYYRRRAELASEGARAEQARITAVEQARTRERDSGRRPETKDAAQDALDTIDEQRIKAAADADKAQQALSNGLRRERLQLDRQIADIDTEIAQLSGDAARAEAIRNQQRIEQVRITAANRFGEDSPEAKTRVQSITSLVSQQTAYNALQRESSTMAERLSNAEENYLITARARGDSQEEIERGLHQTRQQSLGQLGDLVQKARELAAASTDPALLTFAEKLALQYRRVAEDIEPALAKMRAVGDEVADSFGKAAGAIALNARDARGAVFSLVQSLGKIAVRETVEKPVTDIIRKQIGGVIEPGQGGGFGQGMRDIFGVAVQGAATGGEGFSLDGVFGEAVKAVTGLGEASAGSATVLGKLPELAAIPATTSLTALAAAAQAASTALLQVGSAGALQEAAGGGFSLEGLFGGGAPDAGFGGFEVGSREAAIATESFAAETAIATTATAGLAEAGLAAAGALTGMGPIIAGIGALLAATGGQVGGAVGLLQSGIIEKPGGLIGLLSNLFDGGGYTGDGAKMQPAGIVHAGEYVQPQERVREPGALRFMERFREVGMQAVNETFLSRVQAGAGKPGQISMPRGFADGGYVSNAREEAADYAGGGLAGEWGGAEQSAAERMPMQRERLGSSEAKDRSFIVNVNQTFNGPQSKQTMSQGAAEAARALRIELARGTA